MNSLKAWWKKLPDDKRRQYAILGGISAIILIFIVTQMFSSNPASKTRKRASDPETFALGQSREVGMADLQALVNNLGADQDKLRKQIQDGTITAEATARANQQTIDTLTRQSTAEKAELAEKLAKLESKVASGGGGISVGAGAGANGAIGVTIAPQQPGGVRSAPGAPSLSAPLPVTLVAPQGSSIIPPSPTGAADSPGGSGVAGSDGSRTGLRVSRDDRGTGTTRSGTGSPGPSGTTANGSTTPMGQIGAGSAAGARHPLPADAKNAGSPASVLLGGAANGARGDNSAPLSSTSHDENFIPAGSMFEGVSITGLDAPTASAAQKSPTPMLVRIKHEAILPNLASYDISECFVLLSGHGELSSERAKLRTETLSCVNSDRTVIEAKLDGFAVGEDGKVGLRGRLVSKQGAVIARALLAGFLSGIGKGLQPTAVIPLTGGASALSSTAGLTDVLEGGAAAGANTALNQIAKFYLDQAKEMFPVVEIDAGRKVTIVLVRGTSVKKR